MNSYGRCQIENIWAVVFVCLICATLLGRDILSPIAPVNDRSPDSHSRLAGSSPNAPQPEPALPGLLKLFDKYQVVGLSDLHGCAELLAFVEQLVQAPEFAAKVNDVTWEPGNARFQGLMDDFILHGKQVPFKELSQCWRNNTQVHTYSDTPALFHLLRTIRSVNLTLPEARRVRVLLIDPPVDWSRIQSKADIREEDFDRETHMAEVVDREVYAKNRKALFFAGGAHLGRQGSALRQPSFQNRANGPEVLSLGGRNTNEANTPGASEDAGTDYVIASSDSDGKEAPGKSGEPVQVPFDGGPLKRDTADNVRPSSSDAIRGSLRETPRPEVFGALQTLERRHPGTTFNIAIHEGFGDRTDELEARLVSWPRPALAHIRGTWWGELPSPPSGDVFVHQDGTPAESRAGRKIQDCWDAILFLARRKELTCVDPPGTDILGAGWLSELRRRKAIVGGPAVGLDLKEKPHSRQYFPDDAPQMDRTRGFPQHDVAVPTPEALPTGPTPHK